MAGRQEGEFANKGGPGPRRGGGQQVQEFSNEIISGIDDALNLPGNATAPRREARSRGRRGGVETGRRMAVWGASEPIRRLDRAIQGNGGASDRGGRRSQGPEEKTTRRSFSVDEPKKFEKQPPTGMRRVRRWKRWCTVLVGQDHSRDRRQGSGRWRREKGGARWHGGCWNNNGGRRQGRGPL
jgi:hypothetical protein